MLFHQVRNALIRTAQFFVQLHCPDLLKILKKRLPRTLLKYSAKIFPAVTGTCRGFIKANGIPIMFAKPVRKSWAQ